MIGRDFLPLHVSAKVRSHHETAAIRTQEGPGNRASVPFHGSSIPHHNRGAHRIPGRAIEVEDLHPGLHRGDRQPISRGVQRNENAEAAQIVKLRAHRRAPLPQQAGSSVHLIHAHFAAAVGTTPNRRHRDHRAIRVRRHRLAKFIPDISPTERRPNLLKAQPAFQNGRPGKGQARPRRSQLHGPDLQSVHHAGKAAAALIGRACQGHGGGVSRPDHRASSGGQIACRFAPDRRQRIHDLRHALPALERQISPAAEARAPGAVAHEVHAGEGEISTQFRRSLRAGISDQKGVDQLHGRALRHRLCSPARGRRPRPLNGTPADRCVIHEALLLARPHLVTYKSATLDQGISTHPDRSPSHADILGKSAIADPQLRPVDPERPCIVLRDVVEKETALDGDHGRSGTIEVVEIQEIARRRPRPSIARKHAIPQRHISRGVNRAIGKLISTADEASVASHRHPLQHQRSEGGDGRSESRRLEAALAAAEPLQSEVPQDQRRQIIVRTIGNRRLRAGKAEPAPEADPAHPGAAPSRALNGHTAVDFDHGDPGADEIVRKPQRAIRARGQHRFLQLTEGIFPKGQPRDGIGAIAPGHGIPVIQGTHRALIVRDHVGEKRSQIRLGKAVAQRKFTRSDAKTSFAARHKAIGHLDRGRFPLCQRGRQHKEQFISANGDIPRIQGLQNIPGLIADDDGAGSQREGLCKAKGHGLPGKGHPAGQGGRDICRLQRRGDIDHRHGHRLARRAAFGIRRRDRQGIHVIGILILRIFKVRPARGCKSEHPI